MAKGEKPDWLDDDDLIPDGDDDVLDADDVIEEASPAPMLKRGGGSSKREEPILERVSSGGAAARGQDEPKRGGEGGDKSGKAAKSERELRRAHAVRPGEQEITRSPLVLGLGVVALLLALLSLTYWFMIGRSTLERELIAIDEQVNAGQYAGAIQALETFIRNHPSGKTTNEAKIKLGKVRIDKEVKGAAPDWKIALAAFNQFVQDAREVPEFANENENLSVYAQQITLGALEAAAKQKSEELVTIGDEATVLVDRYNSSDKPPVELKKKIKLAREAATAAILKNSTIKATFAEIERFLKENRTIDALASRRRLIDRYPDQEKDRKLSQFQEQILDGERKSVKSDETHRPAERADRPAVLPKPLLLTLHTRVRTDEASEGRTVWGVAQGCVYGVDTITGDPVWRRAIGLDSPFFPQVVDGAIPGLVVFDSHFSEVQLINRLTGELAWRQPLEDVPTGAPLIHENQIYVGTSGNNLYRIDAQTGEIGSKLTFSQPVYSPPALLRDGAHLVLAGNQAVTYTLTLKPLSCVRVSFTGQRPDSIRTPLMPMGATVLMIENDQVGSATMRVFDTTKSEAALAQVGSEKLSAHVVDKPLLRGNQLIVAAERELLSIYTVSDDPEMPKMLPLAKPPAQIEYTGPVYLHAGPDGRLWSISDNVKQFQLSTESLGEDAKKRIYIAAAAQPLQTIGRTLFVGRKQLESDAVSVIQVDGEDMISSWRTVLGAGPLELVSTGPETALCVTAAGDVFQVNSADVESGGFRFRAEASLKLADGLDVPLQSTPVGGGKVAVVCGGKEPKLWIINQIGKIELELPLDEAPVAAPVPLAGGVVVPLTTKLRVLAVPGTPRVDDYLATVGDQAKASWTSIVPLDATHIAIVDGEGKISRLEYRTSPKPHLQQLDSVALGQPVDVPPVLDKGRLIVTDASGRLQVLSATNFERVAEAKLDQPAVGELASTGTQVLVTTSAGVLESYDLGPSLKKLWSRPLANDLLSGYAVVENGAVVLGTMNGSVMSLKPDTGENIKVVKLDQPIEIGPVRLGKFTVVMTIDGALFHVESALGSP